ncbi:MAG: hypothetical protein J5950_00155 [Clostridia bacterium]|nr:hypothetical protein [Clostridia bacterium]
MKKRIRSLLKIAFVLIAVIVTGALVTACNGPEPANQTEPPENTKDNTVAAPTDVVTDAPTAVVTDAPTEAPTDVVTDVPSEAPTEEPTLAPTEEPTQEPTPVPTATPSPEPTATPTPVPTATPSLKPTATPTPAPTATPTPKPTATPTPKPTATPTPKPTDTPRPTQTPEPTPETIDFTVANVFSNNMVVQRGEPVKIWGFSGSGTDGAVIRGEFMGESAETTIQNGEWMLVFDRSFDACADMGNNIRIFSISKEVVLKDVLIGDVYIVAGQSNCAYSMNEHWAFVDASDTERCSRNADYDLPIRINYNTQNVPNTSVKRGSDQEAKDLTRRNTWQIATKSNVTTFSAIGYLFARNYVLLTGGTVPVGMIEVDGNGQPLGAFLCNSTAVKFKTDTYDSSKGYYVTTGVNANYGRFLYNEFMAPFARMPIAGFLWYQGESDYSGREANRYADAFVDFVEYMRGTHNTNNKDFPVYFAEFPSMYTQPAGYSGTWAYMDVGKIRGIMGKMVTMSDNMFQIQSSDVWADKTYWNSLHPNCKYEQALRAAKIACAFNGEGGITMDNASGPVIESVTYSADGKIVTLKYKNVGEGLKTIDGSVSVKGFSALSIGGMISADLTGTIVAPDTVEITSSNTLAGIAYNVKTSYFFGDQLNLCNSAGIPAGAFFITK